MKKIQVFDGISLNYEYNKKSTETTIIFIHPWATNLTVWDNEVKWLNNKGISTLRYDIRGHGLSDSPRNDSYSLEELTEDLKSIIDTLNLKNIILIGHSLGGMIAANFYLKHKKNVAKIVFIDSIFSAPLKFQFLEKPLFLLSKIRNSFSKKEISVNHRKKIFNFSLMHKHPLLCDAEQIAQTSLSSMMFTARTMYENDLTTQLKEIKCPVLVIQGDADPLISINEQKELFSEMLNVSFLQIPNGKHNLITEYPFKISKAINNFIEDIS